MTSKFNIIKNGKNKNMKYVFEDLERNAKDIMEMSKAVKNIKRLAHEGKIIIKLTRSFI